MIVIGMVGTPAAGKSTVAGILAEFGSEWINADLIARECLNDPGVIDSLTRRFGTQVLVPEDAGCGGRIDRKAIADLVFGNDSVKRENLRFLESLVHPRTREEITRRIEAAADSGRPVALLDVPLLFESHWDLCWDAVWCVDADIEVRLRRAAGRGWDRSELERREANQIPIETKSRLSNVVMRNESTLDALRQNLRCHWGKLARMTPEAGRGNESRSGRHCRSDRAEG